MERRKFIKNTLYSSAALASTSILTNSCKANNYKKITAKVSPSQLLKLDINSIH